MSEKALQQKSTALIVNGTVTLTWSGADFQQAFFESIIKKPIALRLSASTTAVGNGVFIGVSYITQSKVYQLAERLTIGTIPAQGSVELTAASIPAMGRLFENIVSITVSFTSPIGGTVTATPIIDDEPPPLSADLGERIGLDAAVAVNNIPVTAFISTTVLSGVNTGLVPLYTVPASKRFYSSLIYISIGPTPSYPGDFLLEIFQTINYNIPFRFKSKMDCFNEMFVQSITIPLLAGDMVAYRGTNSSASGVAISIVLIGSEVF